MHTDSAGVDDAAVRQRCSRSLELRLAADWATSKVEPGVLVDGHASRPATSALPGALEVCLMAKGLHSGRALAAANRSMAVIS